MHSETAKDVFIWEKQTNAKALMHDRSQPVPGTGLPHLWVNTVLHTGAASSLPGDTELGALSGRIS